MTARLEKPIRRELEILGTLYIVELSPAGIMFRPKGMRKRLVAPIGSVLRLAYAHMQTNRVAAVDMELQRVARGRR